MVPLVGLLLLVAPGAWGLSLAPGELVVSGGTSSGGAGLTRVDSATGQHSLIASGSFGDFALASRETIYAIEGGAVVRVDVSTGTKSIISSGGLLIDPQGIAVDAAGQIQVLDLGSDSSSGSLIRIDPATGNQAITSSGGFITERSGGFVDLEISPAGDLIVLDSVSSHVGEIFSVEVATGQQVLLYSDPSDSPGGSEFLYVATGIGVAFNGDIYASNGFLHATGVLQIDAVTGEAQGVGSVLACCYLHSDGSLRVTELAGTDMAIGEDGSGWMVSMYGSGGPAQGLWRWDGMARYENGDVPFVVGSFNEVQWVSSALPVPEPATGLLLGMALAGLAIRRRR